MKRLQLFLMALICLNFISSTQLLSQCDAVVVNSVFCEGASSNSNQVTFIANGLTAGSYSISYSHSGNAAINFILFETESESEVGNTINVLQGETLNMTFANVEPGTSGTITVTLTNLTDGCTYTSTSNTIDCWSTSYSGHHYYYSGTSAQSSQLIEANEVKNDYLYINSVELFGATNESGKDVIGYTNYGNFNIQNNSADGLSAFEISINPRADFYPQEVNTKVYIDFNADLLFTEDEQIGSSLVNDLVYNQNETLVDDNTLITIPIDNSILGISALKMIRIVLNDAAVSFAVDNASNFSPRIGSNLFPVIGEVEDYYFHVPPTFDEISPVCFTGNAQTEAIWFTGGPNAFEDGDDFEITDMHVLQMNANSKYTIESGAKLTLNNSNINAFNSLLDIQTDVNFSHWQGITVEGNTNIAHPDVNGLADDQIVSAEHGILIANNSSIKHAEIAVKAHEIETIIEDDGFGNILTYDVDRGGAIVRLNNVEFTNNQIGVQLHDFVKAETNDVSFIDNCTFTNSEPLWQSENSDIRQIDLVASRNVPITNCSFNKDNGSNGQALEDVWITGVYCLNGMVNLNEADNAPNNFNNLDVGVDMRDLLGLGGHALYGNTFDNVKQGVNATAATAVSLIRNEFLNIPEGTSTTVEVGDIAYVFDDDGNIIDAYETPFYVYDEDGNIIDSYYNLITDVQENWGIFIDDCLDLEIRGNLFETTATTNAPVGMVIKDSRPIDNSITQSNIIRANMVRGPFAIGSVYQGNNSELSIDCNHHRNSSAGVQQSDWGLAVNDGGFFMLNAQGDCIDPEDEPFKNEWHNASTGGLHIASFDAFFANTPLETRSLVLNYDADSEPTLIEASINIPDIDPCLEDNLCLDDEDWGKDPIIDNPEECELSFSGIVRQLRSGKNQQLRDKLECIDEDWANSLLTASYIGGRSLDKASERLDRISNNGIYGQVRQAYQNTIDAIRTNGTGKANPAMEQLNQQAAVVSQSLFQNLSRTAVEMKGGESYKKELHIRLPQQAQAVLSKQMELKISPNPACDYLNIEIQDLNNAVILSEAKNLSYQIYDLSGRMAQNGAVTERINVSGLQTGAYILKLTDGQANFKTAKFIVN